MNKNKTLLGVFLAAFGGICWGFSGSCGEFLFKNYGVPSIWLCSVRMIVSGVIMLAISLVKCRPQLFAMLKNRRDTLQMLLFGLLGILMSQYSYLTAISYSNAGTATVLQYVGPVFIMIIACVSGKRLPKIGEAVALVLAVVGTFLVATHGNLGSLSISPLALFFGILSAVALIFYTMLPASVIAKYGSMPVMGCGTITVGLVFLPIARPWTYDISLDAAGVAAVGGIVIVGTVMAYTFYLVGVEYAGAVKASVASSVEPVAAAVISAVWLGNSFAPLDIVGFTSVISAVIILSLAKNKKKDKQKGD